MTTAILSNLLGFIRFANFNTTADQPLIMPTGRYIVRKISVINPSISLTIAVGGIYTGANKTGAQVVPAGQVYSALVNFSQFIDVTLTAPTLANTSSINTLFFSLTVPQGVPATAHILVLGEDLNPGSIT